MIDQAGKSIATRSIPLYSFSVFSSFSHASTLHDLGTDATDEFDSIGHSEQAQKLLEDYYIGVLSTASIDTRDAVDDALTFSFHS